MAGNAKTYRKGQPIPAKSLNHNATHQTTAVRVAGGTFTKQGNQIAIKVKRGGGAGRVPRSLATPQPVAAVSDPGDSVAYAPANHIHRGLDQPTVGANLPAIPATGTRFFYWTGGTPDQLWVASAGDTVWTPVQYTTNDSGTP